MNEYDIFTTQIEHENSNTKALIKVERVLEDKP
jgi:hypothetical protein